MGLFSKSPNYKELIGQGAKIIDVRTPQEFATGHIDNSVNLPVQQLDQWKSDFRTDDTVILVCKSGARAMMAKGVLKKQGVRVYNAGAWQSLDAKIR